jgi:hypothetical protein
MWIYFKKQGYLFDLEQNELSVSPSEDEDNIFDIVVAGNIPTSVDHELLEIFIAKFTDAIEKEVAVFTFDQERKFSMSLKGEEEFQADVGI